MKICKDCKHAELDLTKPGKDYVCKHQKNMVQDIVNGKWSCQTDCYTLRRLLEQCGPIGDWFEPDKSAPQKYIKKGKEVMVKATIVDCYKSNCRANIQLPNNNVISVHLNDLLPQNLKPYTGWQSE